ncbi:MAG TPA: hypothetical protein VEV16_02010, partial [Daejeonella sp.]|nr:hypothetical protein [Daejeonella sp.]
MKRTVLLLAVLCSWLKCSALCGSTGLRLWPSGKTVKQNTLFVINGYSDSEYIYQLNKKYPIYLRSGDEKIELKVWEILTGYHVIQAIIIPEKKLAAGKEYQLFIDSLPKYAPPYHKGYTGFEKYIPAKW